MRFEIAAQARQIILDLLNGDPTKNRTMNMVAAGVHRNRVESCITTMLKIGEIERIDKGLDARYLALVKTTMSAAAMQTYAVTQQGQTKVPPPPKPEVFRPGYFRNRPDHPCHVAPTNQGGQGAIRRQVHIGSVLA